MTRPDNPTDRPPQDTTGTDAPPSMGVGEFMRHYGIEVGTDDAAALVNPLGNTPGGSEGIAHVLAVAHALIRDGRPVGLDVKTTPTPVEAVALVAELHGFGLYAHDATAEHAAAVIRAAVIGRYDEEPDAALHALDAAGGVVSTLPRWTREALADHESFSVCEHLLDRVRLALRHVHPSPRWRNVPGLGFVVFTAQDIHIDHRQEG